MQALRTTYFAITLDASQSPAVPEPHTTSDNSILDRMEGAIQVLLNACFSNLDPITTSSLYNVEPCTFEKLGHTPHPLLFNNNNNNNII